MSLSASRNYLILCCVFYLLVIGYLTGAGVHQALIGFGVVGCFTRLK